MTRFFLENARDLPTAQLHDTISTIRMAGHSFFDGLSGNIVELCRPPPVSMPSGSKKIISGYDALEGRRIV